MEQLGGAAVGKPSNRRMSLEDYLDLIQSNKQPEEASTSILQKVISMHGFYRFKVPKSDLMEAVRSMELMDPVRSTVANDDVSPCAVLNHQQVIKDLSLLNWQECCITSLESLNSPVSNSILASDNAADILAPKRSRSKFNSALSLKENADTSVAASSAVMDGGGPGTEAAVHDGAGGSKGRRKRRKYVMIT